MSAPASAVSAHYHRGKSPHGAGHARYKVKKNASINWTEQTNGWIVKTKQTRASQMFRIYNKSGSSKKQNLSAWNGRVTRVQNPASSER